MRGSHRPLGPFQDSGQTKLARILAEDIAWLLQVKLSVKLCPPVPTLGISLRFHIGGIRNLEDDIDYPPVRS